MRKGMTLCGTLQELPSVTNSRITISYSEESVPDVHNRY